MSSSTLFDAILRHFNTQTKCQEILASSENHYFLKPFKIKKISYYEAKTLFQGLQKKYDTKELAPEAQNWHKNERKIFIWFLMCYCHLNQTLPDKMEKQEWQNMTKIFSTKDPLLLKYQGLSILKNEGKKIWLNEEDEILVKLVKQKGEGNWNQISKSIFFQERKQRFITPKQCRERWYNHKNEQIVKGEWSVEEDYKLLKYCYDEQKSWCKIVKILNNKRTEHMIKNRYYCLLKKYDNNSSKSDQEKLQNAIRRLEEKKKHEQKKGSQMKDKNKIQQFKGKIEFDKQAIKYDQQAQGCAEFQLPIYFPPFFGLFQPMQESQNFAVNKNIQNNQGSRKGFTFCESLSTSFSKLSLLLEKDREIQTNRTIESQVKSDQGNGQSLKKEIIEVQKMS